MDVDDNEMIKDVKKVYEEMKETVEYDNRDYIISLIATFLVVLFVFCLGFLAGWMLK